VSSAPKWEIGGRIKKKNSKRLLVVEKKTDRLRRGDRGEGQESEKVSRSWVTVYLVEKGRGGRLKKKGLICKKEDSVTLMRIPGFSRKERDSSG